MKDKSKYRFIADKLITLIHSGELVSGEKFYTRQQLCERFNISLMTAYHVQKILQERGLISNVPGVGFFINRPDMYQILHPNSPVRKIRMIGSPQAIGAEAEFGSKLVSGVKTACENHGLAFNIEFVQVLNNPLRIINTSRHLDRDEGLVVFLHDELLPEVVNLLMSPDVRVVTIGKTFPNKSAVLHDWRHVVKEVLAFCRRRHAKKLLYTGQCSFWNSPHIETEYFENFSEMAAAYGFEYETDFSGNFPAIVTHIKEYQPDMVIFPTDEPALRLHDHYFADFAGRPPFVGFGDLPSLDTKNKLRYTYRPDAAEMGRRAVEMVLKLDNCIHPPLDEKVAGVFIERD